MNFPPDYFGKGRQNRFTTINEPGNEDREPIITIDAGKALSGNSITSSVSKLPSLPWYGNLRKLPRFATPYRGSIIDIENKRRFNGVTLYIYSGEINKTTSILIVTTGNVEIIKEYDKYRIPDDFQPNVLFGGRGL